MSANSKRAADTSPIHTRLTLEQVDRIDIAKGRAKRLVVLVRAMLEANEDLDEEADPAAIADILDIVQEDIERIGKILNSGALTQ